MSDGPNPIVRAPLSDAGRERRERMLLELQGVMRRRVRTKRAVRAGGAVCVLGVAGVLAWAGMRQPQQAPLAHNRPANVERAPVEPVASPEIAAKPPLPPPAPAYEIVRTDASSVAKYVAPGGGATRVEVLSDEGLLEALAKTGNVYGFVRSGDHVSVMCYSCDGGTAPGAPPPPAGGAGRPPEPPRGDV